jgi:hypothetical protein
MSDVAIPYWLPATAIRFRGTRTTVAAALPDRVPDGGTDEPAITAAASVVLRADLEHGPFEILVDDSVANETEQGFDVTTDGHPTSASATGAGSDGIPLGETVAVVQRSVEPADGAPPPMSLDEAYVHDFPREARRRDSYREALERLLDRTATVAAEAASESVDAQWSRTRLESLRFATTVARDELNRLDAHHLAWRSRQTVSTVEDLEFVLALHQLPTEDDLLQNAGAGTPWRRVFETLHLMVTCEPAHAPGELGEGYSLEHAFARRRDAAAWHRRPRRVRLTLWQRVGRTAVRLTTTDVDVVDRACRHEQLVVTAGRPLGHHMRVAPPRVEEPPVAVVREEEPRRAEPVQETLVPVYPDDVAEPDLAEPERTAARMLRLELDRREAALRDAWLRPRV